MKTPTERINRLRIATPCPISWDQMTGDNRVRFCDHCHLSVYNISELTRIEAERLIASTEGRLCARLFQRADGTVLTKDCPVGLRALRRRVAKRTAAIFAAMISLTGAALGQNSSANSKATCIQQTRITQVKIGPDHTALSVSGTILDMNGAIIPGARLTITNLKTKAASQALTDDEGRFLYNSLFEGKYSLKVEKVGFKTLTTTRVALEGNQALNIDVTLEPEMSTVMIGVVADDSLIDTPLGTTIINQKMIQSLPH